MNNSKYIVYGLVDKRNINEIRYIGRSSSFLTRPKIHYDASFVKNKNGKYENNYYINRWIRKNGKYDIKIIETCPENIIKMGKYHINYWLNATEILYIAYYKHINNRLTNETAGGYGMLGHKLSDKHIKKLSEANKGKVSGMKNKKHSEETKKKMSDTRKGIKYSEETKLKMSNAKKGKIPWIKGRKHSAESIKKMSDANKGKNNPMFGKVPSYETRQKISKANKGKRTKQVICLNDNKKFNSARTAAKFYNIDRNSIGRICNGKQKQTCKGLVFAFLSYNNNRLYNE